MGLAVRTRPEVLTIGVLGGMGPAATLDFFDRLVHMVRAGGDQDYPPCLIFSASQIPDRTAHLTDGGPDPTTALQDAARVLERGGAGLITIPCNSAHAYLRPIREAVSIPVLDMIGLAAQRLAQDVCAGTGVGVLAATGTIRLGLYDRALSAIGLRVISPRPDTQEQVMAVVRSVKSGARGLDWRLVRAAEEYQQAGAEVIVLGCTELPLAVDPEAMPLPILDATEVLAETALRDAGAELGARSGA